MNKLSEAKYGEAVRAIKIAILQSQYRAAKLVNREQLVLYYGIGCYISQNSRKEYWGTGAIAFISNRLQMELPGLRGFSERNLKNMRTFYEEWQSLDSKSAVVTADLPEEGCTEDDSSAEIRQLQLPNFKDFPVEEFFKIGFTHHIAILSQVKSIEERYFYIKLSAREYLSVDSLKRLIREDVYHKQGALANKLYGKVTDGRIGSQGRNDVQR